LAKLSEKERMRRRIEQLEQAIAWVPSVQPRRLAHGCEIVIADAEWQALKAAALHK